MVRILFVHKNTLLCRLAKTGLVLPATDMVISPFSSLFKEINDTKSITFSNEEMLRNIKYIILSMILSVFDAAYWFMMVKCTLYNIF